MALAALLTEHNISCCADMADQAKSRHNNANKILSSGDHSSDSLRRASGFTHSEREDIEAYLKQTNKLCKVTARRHKDEALAQSIMDLRGDPWIVQLHDRARQTSPRIDGFLFKDGRPVIDIPDYPADAPESFAQDMDEQVKLAAARMRGD